MVILFHFSKSPLSLYNFEINTNIKKIFLNPRHSKPILQQKRETRKTTERAETKRERTGPRNERKRRVQQINSERNETKTRHSQKMHEHLFRAVQENQI